VTAVNRNLSWLELCELASKEQDPKKLIELFTQIETLLAAEDERVRPMPPLPKQSEPQNQTAMNLQQQQAEKASIALLQCRNPDSGS
jgi:hypothetical protein